MTLALLWLVLAHRPALAACVPDGQPAELEDCALRQLTLAEDAVAAVHERLLRGRSPAEQHRLEAEQAAWLASRDRHCDRRANEASGGSSSSELRRIGCLVEWSERRAQQLQRRLERRSPPPGSRAAP